VIREIPIKTRQPQTTTNDTQNRTSLTASSFNQSKFSVSPLTIEGVRLNKLQLNDLLKQHLKDTKVHDIQLSRLGILTIYASDVNSFNRILNSFTSILAANGQALANIYVP
jgi:hypothetical protein